MQRGKITPGTAIKRPSQHMPQVVEETQGNLNQDGGFGAKEKDQYFAKTRKNSKELVLFIEVHSVYDRCIGNCNKKITILVEFACANIIYALYKSQRVYYIFYFQQ